MRIHDTLILGGVLIASSKSTIACFAEVNGLTLQTLNFRLQLRAAQSVLRSIVLMCSSCMLALGTKTSHVGTSVF